MASTPRDENRVPITSNQQFIVGKTVTFTGATGLGAIEESNLFTVTGLCLCSIVYRCVTSLGSAGAATISVGLGGASSYFSGGTAYTLVTAGKQHTGSVTWTTNNFSPISGGGEFLSDGSSFTMTIATATVTSGKIEFYVFYRPISTGASISAT